MNRILDLAHFNTTIDASDTYQGNSSYSTGCGNSSQSVGCSSGT